jgi:hypothetical protein
LILGAGFIKEKAFSINYNYPGLAGPAEIKGAIGRLKATFAISSYSQAPASGPPSGLA